MQTDRGHRCLRPRRAPPPVGVVGRQGRQVRARNGADLLRPATAARIPGAHHLACRPTRAAMDDAAADGEHRAGPTRSATTPSPACRCPAASGTADPHKQGRGFAPDPTKGLRPLEPRQGHSPWNPSLGVWGGAGGVGARRRGAVRHAGRRPFASPPRPLPLPTRPVMESRGRCLWWGSRGQSPLAGSGAEPRLAFAAAGLAPPGGPGQDCAQVTRRPRMESSIPRPGCRIVFAGIV